MGHLTSTSHVMRSDVQSYYASTDHYLVYQQVCAVIPDQRLHALLWDALRCAVASILTKPGSVGPSTGVISSPTT